MSSVLAQLFSDSNTGAQDQLSVSETNVGNATADNPILLECVLREVAYKDRQYIPVSEAVMKAGETIFRGYFRTQKERHGPSGSHVLTICLPVGGLKSRKAPGNANKYVSKKDRC